MKKFIPFVSVFSIFIFLCPSSIAATLNGATTIQIERPNKTPIHVYLKRPKLETPVGLLIYIQDVKCISSAEQFFKQTQQWQHKVARLYVEKIGVNSKTSPPADSCSKAYLTHSSIKQRISDYSQVLDRLRSTADWWNKELYLIGHAEGGLIAGLVAAKASETKKIAIMGFGGGMTMAEAWTESTIKHMQQDGRSVADIDDMRVTVKNFFTNVLKSPQSLEQLGTNKTYRWWASVADIRLTDTLVKIDVPIYLAHGSEDAVIPVESAQKVQDVFISQGKNNLVYQEYTGLDHEFSSNNISQANGVYADAVAWLLN